MNHVAPNIDKTLGIDAPAEEEDASELTCLNKTEISAEQEIRLLIREIQRLQDDVHTVQARLIERTKGTRKARVAMMVEQLSELYHVLEGQLYRAERLISSS
jgi:phenylacetate-coenzyme A ligase PaaK-like adenylate-forming protein